MSIHTFCMRYSLEDISYLLQFCSLFNAMPELRIKINYMKNVKLLILFFISCNTMAQVTTVLIPIKSCIQMNKQNTAYGTSCLGETGSFYQYDNNCGSSILMSGYMNYANHLPSNQKFIADFYMQPRPYYNQQYLDFSQNNLSLYEPCLESDIISANIKFFHKSAPYCGRSVGWLRFLSLSAAHSGLGNNGFNITRVTEDFQWLNDCSGDRNYVHWYDKPPTSIPADFVSAPVSLNEDQDYTVNVTQIVKNSLAGRFTGYGGYLGFLVEQTNKTSYNNVLFNGVLWENEIVDAGEPYIELTYNRRNSAALQNQCRVFRLGDPNTTEIYLNETNTAKIPCNALTEFGSSSWTINGGRQWVHLRSFFNFNLPACVMSNPNSITQATLTLNARPNPANGNLGTPMVGNNSSTLQRVTVPWFCGSFGWGNQPATTNLNEVVVPQSTNGFQNYTLDVTNLVRDMAAFGDFGFFMKQVIEDGTYHSMIFANGNFGTVAMRPTLTICIDNNTTNCPVPRANYDSVVQFKGIPFDLNSFDKVDDFVSVSIVPILLKRSFNICFKNLKIGSKIMMECFATDGRELYKSKKNADSQELSTLIEINDQLNNTSTNIVMVKIQVDNQIFIRKILIH
jgi:hypothetical protein